MRPHPSFLPIVLASLLAAMGCKDDPAPDPATTPNPETTPPATVVPDEGPLPSLRTGTNTPEQREGVTAELLAHTHADAHYYALTLPIQGDLEQLVQVRLGGEVHALASVERSGEPTVLLRAPTQLSSIEGTALIEVEGGNGLEWQALPFSATGPAKQEAESSLPSRWVDAFANELRGDWWVTQSHPWREFASGRVRALVLGKDAAVASVELGFDGRPRHTDLSQLMYTTTATTSMQEALQHDRGLRLRFDDDEASVPIAELQLPGLAAHPFEQMLAALPNPTGGTPEPLAAATPAEFWYLRFDDIRVLLRVLDEADAWFTPVAHIMEERAEVRDLSQRYQRQLGLRRSGLAKTLGHTVIERVAVIGSDPYLRDGSDVTFVFSLRNQAVFDSELARHMDQYRAEIPGIVESQLDHGGHTITVLRDPSGAVRQHRALVGQLALVSNSEAAIEAVLDAIDGKRPRLSDGQDLAYMLARDPGEHDGFAFLGDRFIAEVVGPRQKLLAARRQRALAELLTPGYAALVYGWLEGKAPADTETLISSGLLDRDELEHDDGAAIEFVPGASARSSWGSPSSLTPLIELATPTLVSATERDAYEAFARGYQDYWRQYMDPIAIRFDLDDADAGATATVDIRVLPLIEGSDYGEIEDIVGSERIEVPAIDDGLQMVWAVGSDSNLRRDLDRGAVALTGKADIGLGWLGDWVMVGTLDRKALLELLAAVDEDVQLPPPRPSSERNEELEIAKLAGKLPVYAAAHVRNPVALVGTLAAIKVALNEVAPGMVVWGEHARHGEVPIVRVGIDPRSGGEFGAFADAIALYYVQTADVFALALDPKVLEALIDRITAGGGPKRGVADGPQFVMELRVAEGRAGWTALAWALQGQANRTQNAARSVAEILLRGDPSLRTPEQLVALAHHYFGTYPVSASGRPEFTLTPYGVGDPVHGSEIAPTYPELPVEPSPIATLMHRLTYLRGTVAFDREPARLNPPARSLHTRLQVQMSPAQD